MPEQNATSVNWAPVHRSELPTTRNIGPSIRVREQGTIALNASAAKLLGAKMVEGEAEKRVGCVLAQKDPNPDGSVGILVTLGRGPKNYPEGDLFKFSKGKKSAELQTSAAGLFQQNTTYKYRESGTQSFEVSEFSLDADYVPNPKGKVKALAFTVPAGGLTPPPKRPRKPKEASEGTAEGQAANGAPAEAPQPSMAAE